MLATLAETCGKQCEHGSETCVCGKIILRKEKDEHIANQCPESLLPCPRRDAGCNSVMKRDMRELHDAECSYHCCTFADKGCAFLGTRTALEKHEARYCRPIQRRIAELEVALERSRKAKASPASHHSCQLEKQSMESRVKEMEARCAFLEAQYAEVQEAMLSPVKGKGKARAVSLTLMLSV